jgi:cellobiose phosphorylase
MAQGYWACAAAKAGNAARFRSEVEALATSAQSTKWNFFEIYNGVTGAVDGGWQCGAHWGSCSNQTWSASAYIRMIHEGLFGMEFTPSGIRFAPVLPEQWGAVSLRRLQYRAAVLDIHLAGSGRRISKFTLDGKRQAHPVVPAGLVGEHRVEIVLSASP